MALSGVTCIAGFVGVVARSGLSHGSVIGGVLFLQALVAMSWDSCTAPVGTSMTTQRPRRQRAGWPSQIVCAARTPDASMTVCGPMTGITERVPNATHP